MLSAPINIFFLLVYFLKFEDFEVRKRCGNKVRKCREMHQNAGCKYLTISKSDMSQQTHNLWVPGSSPGGPTNAEMQDTQRFEHTRCLYFKTLLSAKKTVRCGNKVRKF